MPLVLVDDVGDPSVYPASQKRINADLNSTIRHPQSIEITNMGNLMPKDGTAQGVAKVRHYESLFPPSQQLYHDPYAYAMFPGSMVQKWMGPGGIDTLYGWMGMTGFSEMISIIFVMCRISSHLDTK